MKGLTQWLGALSAAVLYLNTGNLQAGDYPQWRGPQRNGVSPETGLLKEWPKEGPKLLWKVSDLGLGYSTPAVAGERLYVLKNEGLENESVVALNSKEGKSVWSARLGQVGNPKQQPNYPAARSTPTVDGELVYALGSDGDLFCLEAATGKARWHKSLRADFEGEPGKWAYAESPLIDRQTLVCAPGGSNATVIALNKQTGDLIWKCAVPGGDQAAYASAIISQAGGVKQYVLFLQKALVGVEAKTGKFLWRYDKTAKNSSANIPTPLADGDYVYSAAGRSGGGLIKLKANAGAFEVEEVCFSQKLPTSIGGAVKVGEHLYGTTGQGVLCAEFTTGKILWEDRGIGPASLCFADGGLYLHGENGEVALVAATPDGYQEKGRFTPPDQPQRGSSKAWAYPVVANGRLYLRDFGMLWCYDIAAH